MIGKKKLSEIREELLALYGKRLSEPDQWFEQKLRKLRRGKVSDLCELASLKLLRDALAHAAQRASKKTRGKAIAK